MQFDWAEFFNLGNMLIPLWETIYMVLISMFFALLIGMPLGVLLVTALKIILHLTEV